jgi:hypothetical protein
VSLPLPLVDSQADLPDTFATVTNPQGRRILDANYVGLWGAISYVTQAMAQFASPFTAQKFGLRFNMWLFTIMKLVVSRLAVIWTC